MEIITWNEYKARCTDKKGFTLTHYSKLFNAAHCRVNIKGLDFQLGYDDRYSTKEWNNQVNQFKKAHLEHFVEITAEVAEEIKNTLSAYEAELVAVKTHLSTGLSGFDYNGAIAKKSHLEMMVAKYTKMVELLPTFAADEDEKTGEDMKNIINKVQSKEILNDTLNAQGIKCYTFDVNANYSNDLSSIYYDDFLAEWNHKMLRFGDSYVVLFASEEIKNASYYKISHLKKMNKQALYDLCEQYDILNYHHSDCDYDENTKQNLIDEIMRYVDNERHYEHHYNESNYHDLDYDFRVVGHCQGDVIKVKLVGSEKEFLKHSYMPDADYLTHIFYDSPVQGYITVLCNGEELTNLDFNSQINFYEVLGFNEYDYWDKQDFINKVKNTEWIVKLEYFDLLIEYLESNLPVSLNYDY